MANNSSEKNNSYFTVSYPDGTKILVGRFKRVDRSQVVDLLNELMAIFIKNNFAVGSTICDSEAWSLMTAIAKLLPVHGSEDKGIDIEVIADALDDEQLASIFFTTSRDPKTGEITYSEEKGWEPSLICKVNNLDYGGIAKKALEKYQAEMSPPKAE